MWCPVTCLVLNPRIGLAGDFNVLNPDVFDKLPAGEQMDCPVLISMHSSFSSGKFISRILWDTMVTFAAKSIPQATLAKMVNRAYREQYWDDWLRYNTWRAENGLTRQAMDAAAAAAAAAQATADSAAAASVAASSATAEAEAARATAAAARAGATTAKALLSHLLFRNQQPARQQAAASAKDFVYRSPPKIRLGWSSVYKVLGGGCCLLPCWLLVSEKRV